MNRINNEQNHNRSIFSWNAQGLNNRSKQQSFLLFLDICKPLAVAIQDHRIINAKQALKHRNYIVYTAATHLVTLIRSDVLSRTIDNSETLQQLHITNNITVQWMELQLSKHHRLLLANVYKWPQSCSSAETEEQACEQFIESITQAQCTPCAGNKRTSTLIIGDFNLPSGPWGLNVDSQSQCRAVELARNIATSLNTLQLQCLNMQHAPNTATRFEAGSSSVLDLAFTDDHASIMNFTIDTDCKHSLMSDHCPIEVQLNFNESQPSISLPSNWRINKDTDWSLFQQALDQELMLSNCMTSSVQATQRDIDQLCNEINDCILTAANKTIGKLPPRKIHQQSDRWISYPGMQQAMQLKKSAERRLARLRSKASISPTQLSEAKQQLARIRHDHDALKREAQQQAWTEVIEQINSEPHDVWSTTKNLMRSASNIDGRTQLSINSTDGTAPSTKQESLDNLTKHFASTFKRHQPEASDALLDEFTDKLEWFSHSSDSPAFNVKTSPMLQQLNAPFLVKDVASVCESTHVRTASGPDDISPHFLHNATPALHAALHRLFNLSWRCGLVPQQWRQANVCAIHKGGDHSLPQNYRPISVTSIIARRLECLIKHRLLAHLNATQFFCSNQYGFRAGRSTSDCLFQLTQAIEATLKHRTRRMPTLFIDIAKAFDATFVEGLLFKLYCARIRGNSWRWLRSFLINRNIRCYDATTRQHGKWESISNGVPQGSVLAPLLFLVFINDLAAALEEANSNCLFFADDIVVWPKHQQSTLSTDAATDRTSAMLISRRINKQNAATMQQSCNILTAWSRRWRVKFSPTKTQLLTFCRATVPQAAQPYYISNFDVKTCKQYRYLGVELQSNGSNRQQFKSVKNKMTFAAHTISKLCTRQTGITLPIARRLCTAIVQAQLAYGLPFWQPTAKQFKQFDALLARPIRRLLLMPRSTGAMTLLIESHMLPSQALRSKLIFNWCSSRNRVSTQQNETKNLIHQHYTAALESNATPSSSLIATLIADERESRCSHTDENAKLSDQQQRFRCCLWRRITATWLSQSQPGRQHSGLRLIWPPLSDLPTRFPLHYKHDKQSDASLRARWRCDLGFGNDSLMSFRRGMNPYCTNCEPDGTGNHALENRQHILLHCTQFARERQQLKTSLQSIMPHCILSVPLILGNCSSVPKRHISSVLSFTAKFLRCVHNATKSQTMSLISQLNQIKTVHQLQHCFSRLSIA
jgi:exonuclease III